MLKKIIHRAQRHQWHGDPGLDPFLRDLALHCSRVPQEDIPDPLLRGLVLGQVCGWLGHADLAVPHLRRYAGLVEKRYGVEHEASADAYSLLAAALFAQGGVARATAQQEVLGLFGRAVTVRIKRLGVLHAATADAHHSLASALLAFEFQQAAIKEWTLAAVIRNRLFGAPTLTRSCAALHPRPPKIAMRARSDHDRLASSSSAGANPAIHDTNISLGQVSRTGSGTESEARHEVPSMSPSLRHINAVKPNNKLLVPIPPASPHPPQTPSSPAPTSNEDSHVQDLVTDAPPAESVDSMEVARVTATTSPPPHAPGLGWRRHTFVFDQSMWLRDKHLQGSSFKRTERKLQRSAASQTLPPEEVPTSSTTAAGRMATRGQRKQRRQKLVHLAPEELMSLMHVRALGVGVLSFLFTRSGYHEARRREIQEEREAAEKREKELKEEKRKKREAAAAAKRLQKKKKEALAATAKAEKKSGPKFRQVHWEPLAHNDKSLWAGAAPIAREAVLDLFPDLTAVMIQEQKTVSKPRDEDKGKDKGKDTAKPKNVMLIDGKKSQNISIMLAQFGRVSLASVVEAIMSMDPSALDLAGVRALAQFPPEQSDVDLIRGHVAAGNDSSSLGKAEKFLLEFSKIPQLTARLVTLEILHTFKIEVEAVQKHISMAIEAGQRVLDEKSLPLFLHMCLQLGNKLNEGTAKGEAKGFKLESFARLSQTKTNSQKDTLLDYIVHRLVEQKHPALEFLQSLDGLKEAAALDVAQNAKHLKKLADSVQKVEALTKRVQLPEVKDSERLKRWVAQGNSTLDTAATKQEELNALDSKCVEHFGEDKNDSNLQQVLKKIVEIHTSVAASVAKIPKSKRVK